VTATAWAAGPNSAVGRRYAAVMGYIGIGFGVFAAFLAIPPIEARSQLWPVAVGIPAVALGIWTVTRGRRRLGWGAVASGLLGIGLGILATRSSTTNLAYEFDPTLIGQTFGFATPLVFGAIAGMFAERSGVTNIGLEGMMLMGAFWGFFGSARSGNWAVGILIGAAVGGLLALVYAYFAIHLRANQIVGGTGVNFLAYGITGYFFVQLYNGQSPGGVSVIPNTNLPKLGQINLLTWASLVLVVAAWVVLFKTPIGLRIRACGEHPRAADTVGINVYLVRYGCVVLSGVLVAIGGVFLSLGPQGGTFTPDMSAGKGFIALAAMIFGNWKPAGAFAAALLFGFSDALGLRLQVIDPGYATLFHILPYVLTLIASAGIVGRTVAPAADGKPYVRQ
jgi:simple sugar transport system permease protein